MKNIIKASQTKSLNIQKPLVTFFSLNNAIVLTLMTDKFIESIEENRLFKLKNTEYAPFITYHNFTKAVDYFERIGLLRTYEDVNGIQAGKSYMLNPNMLEKIFAVSLKCSDIIDYSEYIKEYVKEDFSINDIERAIN